MSTGRSVTDPNEACLADDWAWVGSIGELFEHGFSIRRYGLARSGDDLALFLKDELKRLLVEYPRGQGVVVGVVTRHLLVAAIALHSNRRAQLRQRYRPWSTRYSSGVPENWRVSIFIIQVPSKRVWARSGEVVRSRSTARRLGMVPRAGDDFIPITVGCMTPRFALAGTDECVRPCVARYRSTAIATALPPPRQKAAMPRRTSRRIIS